MSLDSANDELLEPNSPYKSKGNNYKAGASPPSISKSLAKADKAKQRNERVAATASPMATRSH